MSTIKYGTRGFKIGDTVYIPKYTKDLNSYGHLKCIINSFSVETLVEKKTNRAYAKSKVFVNVTWVRNGTQLRYPISSLYKTKRGANKRAKEEHKDYMIEYKEQELTRQEQEIKKCEQKIKDCKKDIKSIKKVLNSL